MNDYMTINDDDVELVDDAVELNLDSNEAIPVDDSLSITDILGPDLGVVNECDRHYESISQTAVQLSYGMRKLLPSLTMDDFSTITLYHQALEHMRSRFPDGKTVGEVFPAVTMRYFSLDLSDSQRDNLVGAYELAKNYAKPEIQKKLIE